MVNLGAAQNPERQNSNTPVKTAKGKSKKKKKRCKSAPRSRPKYAPAYAGYEIVEERQERVRPRSSSNEGARVSQLERETLQIGEYKHDINRAHAYKLDLGAQNNIYRNQTKKAIN